MVIRFLFTKNLIALDVQFADNHCQQAVTWLFPLFSIAFKYLGVIFSRAANSDCVMFLAERAAFMLSPKQLLKSLSLIKPFRTSWLVF